MKDVMHIWALLDLVHKTVNLPKLKAIHDAAEAELVEIAEAIGAGGDEPMPAPTTVPESTDEVRREL